MSLHLPQWIAAIWLALTFFAYLFDRKGFASRIMSAGVVMAWIAVLYWGSFWS